MFKFNTLLTILLFDLTRIPEWIVQYLFEDFGFLRWLILVMTLDFITGVTKVWKNEGWSKVTSRGFRDSVSKVIQYGSFLIITHIITHFEIAGQPVLGQFLWLNKLAFEFLIFIESKSVYENITAISPKFDFIQHIGGEFVKFYEENIKKKRI